jgi:hypothetical protein
MAFTYFVPISKQPKWIIEAKLIPIVQDAADMLLSVIPGQPNSYAYVPQHEEIRQAPSQGGQDEERNARNQPKPDTRHDPMAELIRKAERAPKTAPKAGKNPGDMQQKSAAAASKSYGASDRQALDRLVQTGGSGNR